MKIRWIDYFRSLQSGQPVPDGFGSKLGDALQDIQKQATVTEGQGNLNPSGQPDSPPPIGGLSVVAQNGHFDIAISDGNAGIRRGINYWVEHDTSPDFTNPHHIDLGQSRNHTVFLGNQTLYWRGYSSYGSSPAGPAAYHGSPVKPLPVSGGGIVGPGFRQASQGAGTGAPGQGLYGPGPVPIRDQASGISWTAQRAQINSRTGTPAGDATGFPSGVTPSGGGGGGGGGGLVQPICLEDTWAHLSLYPASSYSTGLFWASDRTVLYRSNGTTWTYHLGQMNAAIGSLPTLTTTDAGFLFYENVTFFHQVRWTGTVWERGPNDRDSADTFYDKGSVPSEGGWHACDGSSTTYFDYTAPGTPISRTLPNSNATAMYSKGGASYSGTLVNKVVPTISGATDSHNAALGITNGTALAGATQAVVTAVTDPGHTHPMSAANAPIALPGDPIDHFLSIRMYRR